jgi:molybdate transport system regulatory protein
MPKKLYTVPATCHVCSRRFMARYNVGSRAKVCTSPGHACKKGDKKVKGDQKIPCVEKCCRSRYARSASSAAMDNAIDPKKVLSDSEFKQVVAETRKTKDLLSIALRFIAATGCRLGEALLVRMRDVDFRRGNLSVVKIPTLKRGGRPIRSVFLRNDHWMIAELRFILSVLKDRKSSKMLFPVARRSLQRRLEGILEKYKPDREGLIHIFRHTRASQLVKAGVPMNTIRQQLGWSSIELLKIYAHSGEDEIASALEGVGK